MAPNSHLHCGFDLSFQFMEVSWTAASLLCSCILSAQNSIYSINTYQMDDKPVFFTGYFILTVPETPKSNSLFSPQFCSFLQVPKILPFHKCGICLLLALLSAFSQFRLSSSLSWNTTTAANLPSSLHSWPILSHSSLKSQNKMPTSFKKPFDVSPLRWFLW